MKDAKNYERKLKKLLRQAKKKPSRPPISASSDGRIRAVIEAILLADATPRDLDKAIGVMEKEFVDFNELRVAPEKEILECIGREHPEGRIKALTLATVLNSIYERSNRLSLEFMDQVPKRDVRRRLREFGLPPFAEALLSMVCFDVHAIPVDASLLEVLQMNHLIPEDAALEETQVFLERIISPRDGLAAHEFFRGYISQHAKALAKKRKADAERRAAEEEARRKAEEEARRKAEEAAARKALKEAERQARQAQREAAQLAKKSVKASKKPKPKSKPVARKAAPKPKAGKKPTKKPSPAKKK
jgi:hypothetical protein